MTKPLSSPHGCGGCACAAALPDPGRRQALAGALATLLPIPALAQSPGGSSGSRKPESGDRLAFQAEDRKDREIRPGDLVVGAVPTLAYPVDPASGKVLVSRVNLLVVARLKLEVLKASSAKHAAEGVVAFSAVCTHYGCPVTTLHPGQTQLVCNCHGSVFDAADRGVVTAGPATRRLPMLPLSIRDGVLTVAGRFDGPLGPPT